MNTLTAAERGDLAERMLPIAARIACITNGDGDANDINHALNPLDRQELVAVIVCLGAMVDPAQGLRESLGFIDWDENGLPLAVEPRYGDGTIRSLVPSHVHTPVKVDDLIEHEQRLQARHMHCNLGMHSEEIAAHLPVCARTIRRWKTEGWVAA